MQTDSRTAGAPPGSAPPGCSADGRGYARGYAAGIKRVKSLEAEIARLNEIKTPLPPLPLPDSHDVTIEYLITTAEALIGAANLLMQMRTTNHLPAAGKMVTHTIYEANNGED